MDKINQKRFVINDLNGDNDKTRSVEQEWIAPYIALSQSSLDNHLKVRPPSRVTAKLPTPIKVGTTVFSEVESLWEPGVTAKYQWFLGSKPIEGAKTRSLKIVDDFSGRKLKLRITLKKDGVSDTVYFTRAHKVRSE